MNDLKKEILIILNGFKFGFKYGFKIRAMHCIVMAILFFKGSLLDRLKIIYKLTKEHSLKLGFYVSLYKLFLLILKKINKNKTLNLHSIISGLIAGFIVFRKKTTIDMQIIFYLISRNLHGISNILLKKYTNKKDYFNYVASINWALVMYLFKIDKSSLQSSLTKSMVYLYDESEQINTISKI